MSERMDTQTNGWLCRQSGQLLNRILPLVLLPLLCQLVLSTCKSYSAQACFALALVVEGMPASVLPSTQPQPHGLSPNWEWALLAADSCNLSRGAAPSPSLVPSQFSTCAAGLWPCLSQRWQLLMGFPPGFLYPLLTPSSWVSHSQVVGVMPVKRWSAKHRRKWGQCYSSMKRWKDSITCGWILKEVLAKVIALSPNDCAWRNTAYDESEVTEA